MPDYVHMRISISPKYSVSYVVDPEKPHQSPFWISGSKRWRVNKVKSSGLIFIYQRVCETCNLRHGKKNKKNGQQPLFQIPGGSGHQQVDALTHRTLQIVSRQSVIRFQVTDNRFNGCAPPALFSLLVFLVTRLSFERLPRQNDARAVDFALPTIAAIAYGLLGGFPARLCHMTQYFR